MPRIRSQREIGTVSPILPETIGNAHRFITRLLLLFVWHHRCYSVVKSPELTGLREMRQTHWMKARQVDRMAHQTNTRILTLALLFAFCQVIGTMCAVPDLSLAEDAARLAQDMSGMVCPMDGTIMCPPSATSSPERQIKPPAAVDVDQMPPPTVAVTATSLASTLWSWSSVHPIAPISIASSSVLRI